MALWGRGAACARLWAAVMQAMERVWVRVVVVVVRVEPHVPSLRARRRHVMQAAAGKVARA